MRNVSSPQGLGGVGACYKEAQNSGKAAEDSGEGGFLA